MKNWWLLVFLLAVFGCYKEKIVLNELQVTACNSASSNNNCDRLIDLGLITPEECCNALNKCCN
ncbi:MAG: hypothetical protein Q8O03_09100 [Nanoarchaeota archaeon]|nr:hypothetical protein [Nanoarchaeota archaeon]